MTPGKKGKEEERRQQAIDNIVSKLKPGYRDVYRDRKEIMNYNQDGSYFFRLSEKDVLNKIVDEAVKLGLPADLENAFRANSDIEKGRQKSADPATDKHGKKDQGTADKFDLIAELGGQYFCTPQGLPFYVGKNQIPVGVDSPQFGGLLSNLKYQAKGIPASGEEISNVQRLTRYLASKNIKDVGVRSAWDGDSIVYDPIRQDGKVYFITESGYELRTPDTPCTVRYTGMLEAPIEEGTVEDHLSLVRLWHLDQKSEILSMGLDFCRVIPDIPQAIENVDGPHGSGKTSYTETKRSIFDPNGAPTQSLKYDERDLSISALHQGMLAFDNVNAS